MSIYTFYKAINPLMHLKFICHLLCDQPCWSLRVFCFKDTWRPPGTPKFREETESRQHKVWPTRSCRLQSPEGKHREAQTMASLVWMRMAIMKKSKGLSPESNIQVDMAGVRKGPTHSHHARDPLAHPPGALTWSFVEGETMSKWYTWQSVDQISISASCPVSRALAQHPFPSP